MENQNDKKEIYRYCEMYKTPIPKRKSNDKKEIYRYCQNTELSVQNTKLRNSNQERDDKFIQNTNRNRNIPTTK